MLRIGDQRLAPKLVVFDKDGTLIAFDAMWHAWYDRLIASLQSRLTFTAEALLGLAGTLGYAADTGEWDPQGPLTLASTIEVELLVASQLYRYLGLTWHEALEQVLLAAQDARGELFRQDLLEPLGDIAALLSALRAVGLKVALATADTRVPTQHALDALDIADLFDTVVCGDDGIAVKPAPDMGLEVCRRLGVAPAEAVMIGDTTSDLQMARKAGFGWAVAVATGASTRDDLAPLADLVISGLHEIEVLP
ncbi:MAG: HAD family hydrolase [Anaerolineae bacterium]|jgi:phosphoglycolate phosphatase